MLTRLLLVLAAIALWILVRSGLKRRASGAGGSARPADFAVNDAMLATRFSALAEGPQGVAFRAFLARREPGDQLWCVHEQISAPRAGTAYLVIVRAAGPGDRVVSVGDARGRIVAKFQLPAA